MEAASGNWTVFKDATAQAARSYSGTLGDLAQALDSAGPFASKSECPLVSGSKPFSVEIDFSTNMTVAPVVAGDGRHQRVLR